MSRDLESQGFSVWLDERMIRGGQSISDEVEKGLRRFDVFVIVLSPNSVKSEWVKDELRVAIQRRHSKNRRAVIIPVLLKECRIPIFLEDYKYISFQNPKSYSNSLAQLCNSIIFSRPLHSKFRTTYSGGFIVDSIQITTKISGSNYQKALYQERYTITPIKPITRINKEINVDGRIIGVHLSNGTVIRKPIGKKGERWLLTPSTPLASGKAVNFNLSYELVNEFRYVKRWYYSIDSPTRLFVYKFIFAPECFPKSFKVTLMQTQTTILEKALTRRSTIQGSVFEYKVAFPSWRDRFEFTWI